MLVQTRTAESPLHLALRLHCIDIARTVLESPSFDILLSDSRQPSKVRIHDSIYAFIWAGELVIISRVKISGR